MRGKPPPARSSLSLSLDALQSSVRFGEAERESSAVAEGPCERRDLELHHTERLWRGAWGGRMVVGGVL